MQSLDQERHKLHKKLGGGKKKQLQTIEFSETYTFADLATVSPVTAYTLGKTGSG